MGISQLPKNTSLTKETVISFFIKNNTQEHFCPWLQDWDPYEDQCDWEWKFRGYGVGAADNPPPGCCFPVVTRKDHILPLCMSLSSLSPSFWRGLSPALSLSEKEQVTLRTHSPLAPTNGLQNFSIRQRIFLRFAALLGNIMLCFPVLLGCKDRGLKVNIMGVQ